MGDVVQNKCATSFVSWSKSQQNRSFNPLALHSGIAAYLICLIRQFGYRLFSDIDTLQYFSWAEWKITDYLSGRVVFCNARYGWITLMGNHAKNTTIQPLHIKFFDKVFRPISFNDYSKVFGFVAMPSWQIKTVQLKWFLE